MRQGFIFARNEYLSRSGFWRDSNPAKQLLLFSKGGPLRGAWGEGNRDSAFPVPSIADSTSAGLREV